MTAVQLTVTLDGAPAITQVVTSDVTERVQVVFPATADAAAVSAALSSIVAWLREEEGHWP